MKVDVKEAPEITGEIFRVKKSPEDTEGLVIGLRVENGSLILDLSKPVQYIGFTLDESKGFTVALMEATVHAMMEGKVEKKDLN